MSYMYAFQRRINWNKNERWDSSKNPPVLLWDIKATITDYVQILYYRLRAESSTCTDIENLSDHDFKLSRSNLMVHLGSPFMISY